MLITSVRVARTKDAILIVSFARVPCCFLGVYRMLDFVSHFCFVCRCWGRLLMETRGRSACVDQGGCKTQYHGEQKLGNEVVRAVGPRTSLCTRFNVTFSRRYFRAWRPRECRARGVALPPSLAQAALLRAVGRPDPFHLHDLGALDALWPRRLPLGLWQGVRGKSACSGAWCMLIRYTADETRL